MLILINKSHRDICRILNSYKYDLLFKVAGKGGSCMGFFVAVKILLSNFDELLIDRVEEVLAGVLVKRLSSVLAHVKHFRVQTDPVQVAT